MAPTKQTVDLRARFDEALGVFLADEREELVALHPTAASLVDEIARLLAAGGRRLRPAFCFWGCRAAGGRDDARLVRAAASLELLHVMALVHDDVIDGATERRGVATVHAAAAAATTDGRDPAMVGRGVAIVVGDLAAVLADRMLATSGFAEPVVAAALARSHAMRLAMAAGEHLDVVGVAIDPERQATLKGGAYTVTGPLLLGAALGAADSPLEDALRAFGEPLGAAFQLADDLRDGDAAAEVDGERVAALGARALAALDVAGFPAEVDAALRALATVAVTT
jgi:geranylgeranyl diphosphate synthase, type I